MRHEPMNIFDKYPIVKDNVIVIEDLRGIRLINYNTGKSFIINQVTVSILKICNGNLRINDIIAAIYDSAPLSNKMDYTGKILRTFNRLINNGFIMLEKEPFYRPVNIKQYPLSVLPTNIIWELTDYCNLKCRHCYRTSDGKKTRFMNREDLLFSLRKLKELGVLSVHLTGGEPTSHPFFIEIFKSCVNVFSKVIVLTNGLLINIEIINLFAQNKKKLITHIDLDGSTALTHDKLRGKNGAFKKTVYILNKMNDAGVDFKISMNVYPDNLHQIEDTANLGKKLGASGFACSPVQNIGRGENMNVLNEKQNGIFLKQLNRLYDQQPDYIICSPFTIEEIRNRVNCGAGSMSITVSPSGDIRPCVLGNENFGKMGNMFTEDPDDIFKREIFKKYYNLLAPTNKTCADCIFTNLCFGCFMKPIVYDKYFKNQKDNYKCRWKEKYL
jgi:radical SAM protein with 4Fe4S-binding SPASM domain